MYTETDNIVKTLQDLSLESNLGNTDIVDDKSVADNMFDIKKKYCKVKPKLNHI